MKKNKNIHHKGSNEILTGEGSEGNGGGEKKQHKQKQDGTKEGAGLVGPFLDPHSGEFETTNVVGAKGDEKFIKQAAEGSSQSRDSIREGYILKIREKINWLIAERSILEAMIEEAIVKFPDDERFIKYRDQLYKIFKRRCNGKEEGPTGSCTGQTDIVQDHDHSDEVLDVKVRVDDVCEERPT